MLGLALRRVARRADVRGTVRKGGTVAGVRAEGALVCAGAVMGARSTAESATPALLVCGAGAA